MSQRKGSKRLLGQILLSFGIAITQLSALAVDLGQNGSDPLQAIPKDQRGRFKARLDRYIRYEKHNQRGELFKMFDAKTRAAILDGRDDTDVGMQKSPPATKVLEIRFLGGWRIDKDHYSLNLVSTIKTKDDNYTKESRWPTRIIASFEQNDWYFSRALLVDFSNIG